MFITKTHLKVFKELDKQNVGLFFMHILNCVTQSLGETKLKDNAIVALANTVLDCYLVSDAPYSVGYFADLVVENYEEIKKSNLSTKEILRRYVDIE